MHEFTQAEEAFKRGYKEGFYAGRCDSVNSSAWGTGTNPHRPCLACGYRGAPTKFCPECGRAMANPVITLKQ